MLGDLHHLGGEPDLIWLQTAIAHNLAVDLVILVLIGWIVSARKGLRLSEKQATYITVGARLATLFSHFADRADHLERLVQKTWYEWHEEGEKLVYPLGESIPASANLQKSAQLSAAKNAFCTLFNDHVDSLKRNLPHFASDITALEYPSNLNYERLVFDLHEHAHVLREEANLLWKATKEGWGK